MSVKLLREPFTATKFDGTKYFTVIATGNGMIVQNLRRKKPAIELARLMNEAFKLGYDSGFKNGRAKRIVAFDF